MILVFTPPRDSKFKHHLQADHLYMLHTSPVDLNSVFILAKHSHTSTNFSLSSLSTEGTKLLEKYMIGSSKHGWFPFFAHQQQAQPHVILG